MPLLYSGGCCDDADSERGRGHCSSPQQWPWPPWGHPSPPSGEGQGLLHHRVWQLPSLLLWLLPRDAGPPPHLHQGGTRRTARRSGMYWFLLDTIILSILYCTWTCVIVLGSFVVWYLLGQIVNFLVYCIIRVHRGSSVHFPLRLGPSRRFPWSKLHLLLTSQRSSSPWLTSSREKELRR